MSHYFESPSGAERRREVRASIWGRDFILTTANAVFSAARLDPGTTVLLREVGPDPASRRLLDLGCGYGPIAVALASECPDAIVDAVDVNERALALTRLNAETAGVGDRVRALLPDEVDADTRYDEIWSNPPIRIGKPALHELLATWLPRLAADGVARLVVSKNLGADSLQRWLGEQGWDCRRVSTAKGFRVFDVRHRV
ncbi:MAG TPA: methyltransferase [Propionibacteriaceae bacterium]|nr:methyltransferase [Propionibacteriaceae bacterium]